jgi:ankyrin repeat protein
MTHTHLDIKERDARRFIQAAKTGDVEALRKLAESGCPVDARDSGGNTALMWASGGNVVESVRWLLANGADIEAKNDTDFVSAMDAAINASTESLEILLKAGCRVDRVDKHRIALLMCAAEAMSDYPEEGARCIRMLFDAGCDWSARDFGGRTALDRAIRNGWVDVAQVLTAERERRELANAAGGSRQRKMSLRV